MYFCIVNKQVFSFAEKLHLTYSNKIVLIKQSQ